MKLKKGTDNEITEDQIIKVVTQFVMECDCDDLATLVGQMFGGECFYKFDETYTFIPNEDYGGAFDG